jgi:hypothetical protein
MCDQGQAALRIPWQWCAIQLSTRGYEYIASAFGLSSNALRSVTRRGLGRAVEVA